MVFLNKHNAAYDWFLVAKFINVKFIHQTANSFIKRKKDTHRACLDEHILLFDEHKFNLMNEFYVDEFCYQKPTIEFCYQNLPQLLASRVRWAEGPFSDSLISNFSIFFARQKNKNGNQNVMNVDFTFGSFFQ